MSLDLLKRSSTTCWIVKALCRTAGSSAHAGVAELMRPPPGRLG
jgi:hypothetical protein